MKHLRFILATLIASILTMILTTVVQYIFSSYEQGYTIYKNDIAITIFAGFFFVTIPVFVLSIVSYLILYKFFADYINRWALKFFGTGLLLTVLAQVFSYFSSGNYILTLIFQVIIPWYFYLTILIFNLGISIVMNNLFIRFSTSVKEEISNQ